MMQLAPLTFESVAYVAENMREWDKREIYATRWSDDPLDVARDCMAIPQFSWAAGRDGVPIAAIGAVPLHPNVWSVWMFATDEFHRIRFSLTKFVKRSMIPALVEQGAHRAQCYSMEGHGVAHRWLESLGAKAEQSIPEYGRNRENFICYVWNDHVPRCPKAAP